jgi:hypothetical protein
MKKKTGLKTSLNFRFNTNEMDFPDLDFIIEEPKKQKESGVKVIKKKNNHRKSSQKELF